MNSQWIVFNYFLLIQYKKIKNAYFNSKSAQAACFCAYKHFKSQKYYSYILELVYIKIYIKTWN